MKILLDRYLLGTLAVVFMICYLPFSAQAQGIELEEIESWVAKHITADNPHIDQLMDTLFKVSKDHLEHQPAIIRRLMFVSVLRPAVLLQLRSAYHGAIKPYKVDPTNVTGDFRNLWPEGFIRHPFHRESYSQTMESLARVLHAHGEIQLSSMKDVFNSFDQFPEEQLQTIRSSALFQFDEAFEKLALNQPKVAKKVGEILNDPNIEALGVPYFIQDNLMKLVLIMGSLDKRAEASTDMTLLAASTIIMTNDFSSVLKNSVRSQRDMKALWEKEFPGKPYPGEDPDDCEDLLK